MTGHAGPAIVQNQESDIGIVERGIGHLRQTGMEEGGVTGYRGHFLTGVVA